MYHILQYTFQLFLQRDAYRAKRIIYLENILTFYTAFCKYN